MALRNSLDPKITDYTPIATISRINVLYVLITNVLYWRSHTLVSRMILFSEMNSDSFILS